MNDSLAGFLSGHSCVSLLRAGARRAADVMAAALAAAAVLDLSCPHRRAVRYGTEGETVKETRVFTTEFNLDAKADVAPVHRSRVRPAIAEEQQVVQACRQRRETESAGAGRDY